VLHGSGSALHHCLDAGGGKSPSDPYVLDTCRAEARNKMTSDPASEMRSDLSVRLVHGILTRRETELLPLLAEGLSDKEIAAKLHIATQPVKTHLQNIYRKLNAKGRTGAVKKARYLELIPYI
jgi:LuxR family maltose regulon positive regulatory protein